VKPSQPAPIRELREEAPVQAKAAPAPVARTPAPTHSVGMVERIIRFFRGAQPATAAQPAAGRAPDGRGGRNDRNAQRRDGRDGRGGKTGRDGQRRDEPRREESRGNRGPAPMTNRPADAKAAESRTADGRPADRNRNEQAQKQRQPQRPAEPRPVAAKVADDNRQPSAPRPPRPPRPPRGEPAPATAKPADAAVDAIEPNLVAMSDGIDVHGDQLTNADGVVAAGVDATQETTGEGSSRRRRGRRGGRRRRRGAEGGAPGEAGSSEHEHDEASGDVVAALRSQPEFDFDDEDINSAPVAVPASTPVVIGALVDTPAPQAVAAAPYEQPVDNGQAVSIEIADVDNGPVESISALDTSIEPAVVIEPFMLEPASMTVADTASVGLQDAPSLADERPVAPGLFDQGNASDEAGHAEAAASAIANQMDTSEATQDQDKQNA